MKPLFNFQDPKFNEGFQIDMSLLTPEQRNHVLQMFEARGVKVIPNGCPLKYQWSKQYISLLKEVDGNNMKLWDGGFEDLPLITYPELCSTVVRENRTTQNQSADAQLKETITDCGKKTLMDNPTIADHIGSHINLALDYARALVNENTSLRQENTQLKNDAKTDQATISRINEKLDEANEDKQELEQENAQLKELNQSLASRNIYTIDQQEQTIAQLKEQVEELTQQVLDLNRLGANFERENAQLKSDLQAANQRTCAQVIGNTEPVYDEKWLDNVLMEYADKKYGLFGENYIVAVANLGSWAVLDTKTSANVIMAALAKKLNPLFEVDKNQSMFCIQRVHEEVTTGMTYLHMVDCAHIFTSEQAAQKAIDILNGINPEILKNYFA